MTQPRLDWSADVSLPVSGRTPAARHASASGAQQAAGTRGKLTLAYWALLRDVGPRSDHEASKALGCGLSSINSVRDALKDLVEPSGDFQVVTWPSGRVTERVRWRIKK